MAESLAERVALEITRYWSGDSADYEVALRYIQAAIDEAVLHNFMTGELVEVAVRAARERFSKECERFHNEGKECATCGRKENFTQQELDEAVLAENEACASLAEHLFYGAGIGAAIRARMVGAPTSTK
jgi:hypothetical protein